MPDGFVVCPASARAARRELWVQPEPQDPLALLLLASVAVALFGLAHVMMGGGRNALDYALCAVLLFGGSLIITMIIAGSWWILVQFVTFLEDRQTKKAASERKKEGS